MSIINFTKDGRFEASADAIARVNELLRSTATSGEREDHIAMGSTILGPVLQVAEYEAWTDIFFSPLNIGDGEILRIAHHKPIATALSTSLNGEPLFTRPGRKYSSLDYASIDAGLEIGWDDMRNAGWPVLERLMIDAGQTLARKRDALGKAILDSAVSTSSHSSNSTGNLLNKAAVDLVFKSAATLGWKIDRVAVNSGTIMDMTGWVQSANAMWQYPTEMGAEIMRNGFVTNYGGASWYAYSSVPTTQVYFSASPEKTFAKKVRRGDLRTASDIDIRKRIDMHVWDETLGYYLGNPYAIWRINITS